MSTGGTLRSSTNAPQLKMEYCRKTCYCIVLMFLFFGINAQFEVKRPWLTVGVTSTALITYGLGGIPDAHLTSNAHWGGAFRPERSDWHRSGYLFGGLQFGLMGLTALYAPQSEWKDIALVSSQALSVTYLLSQSSKALFPRLRPYAMNGATRSDYNRSFWSGTSAISLALTGLSWRFADAYMPKHKLYVKAGTCLLGSAVMYSRVKAGQHHPSDVLIGGMVGFVIGYFMPQCHSVELNPTGFTWRF